MSDHDTMNEPFGNPEQLASLEQRAMEFAKDQLQRHVDMLLPECECEDCPECGKLPHECSGTTCAQTCQCTACDHCLAVDAIESLAAALANQQGVGAPDCTGKWFFAADPAHGEFDLYGSLDEAKASAQEMLGYASDEAADSGWADDPPQICYGLVLGECQEIVGSRRPAPEGSDFTELVEFKLAEISLAPPTQPAGDMGQEQQWLLSCTTYT